MSRLRGVPRTAAFAWSPSTQNPLLATGTKAGAVDADFSSDTQLEVWDASSNASDDRGQQPAGKVDTDSRFHDIAWVETNESGIIAGALESGSLDLWDSKKLLEGQSSLISRTTKHSDAIKALQFNPVRHELLATAGAKSELFVSDLGNINNPFRLGNSAARAEDLDCIDWNKKVSHILVTGSHGGFVTVWDVREKKESLTLNNHGRKPVSAVAWDPDKSTRLATAVPRDDEPVILIWDLRNSKDPEKILRGHDSGVLSLSWCTQDNSLLLSCGRDNRTVCWNPQTGESYGEVSIVKDWTFQTEWYPRNPFFFATASFDGSIAIHTLQTLSRGTAPPAHTAALDGEDFFNRAQTRPSMASFSLPRAPKWLRRPVGASFAFAGKILTYNLQQETDSTVPRSEIRISTHEIDSEIGMRAHTFSKAVHDHDLASICETRVSNAQTEQDKADWSVIETLISQNPRKDLLAYLGLTGLKDGDNKTPSNALSKSSNAQSSQSSMGSELPNKTNRLSAYFEKNAETDGFLSDLASTKGAKTNSPFQLLAGDEPDIDKQITQALTLGDFDQAVELSFQEGRLSDALMIATCGGRASIEKVQKAYFQSQASGPRYLRLLASIVGQNLWDVVYNADLQDWKEVMATICTYASAEDFPDLCEALGDRLEEQSTQSPPLAGGQRNASFCYLAGSNLEKVVDLWIHDLEHLEKEQAKHGKDASAFSIHASALQNLIEKVTVFREATHYQDTGAQKKERWKLEALYQRYVDYAEIVATHGYLEVAETYLALLPETHRSGFVAKTRINEGKKKTVAVQSRPVMGNPSASRPGAPSLNARGPSYGHQPNTYAPEPNQQPQVPYTSQSAMRPPSRQLVPPPPTFGSSVQGPPRLSNASPNIPPSKIQHAPNWNDTPEEFFKQPTSRRGTPISQPVIGGTSFTNPPTATPPSSVGLNQGTLPRGPPIMAPPPKGPAPSQRSMTPLGNQANVQPERPPSVAANAYAPPPPSSETVPQPQVSKGRPPYSGPPPSREAPSRYAPATAAQQPAPFAQGQKPPPPSQPPRHVAPTAAASMTRVGGASTGAARPLQGPSLGASGDAPQPQRPQPIPPPQNSTPKHPPGDRSHIPNAARPIYSILNEEMQRIKPLAPASYKNHVSDAEKRLNILFDHLNNETLLKETTINSMVALSQALKAKDYDQASGIHVDLLTNKTEECANWMPGVKRLIGMSKMT